MKKCLVPMLWVFQLLVAFPANAQSNVTFEVKGVIDTVPNATYYVVYKQGEELILDTVSLDSASNFSYTGKIAEPAVFNLAIQNINPKFAGDADVYSFWVEPGVTTVFKGKANWKVNGVHGLVASGKIERQIPSKTEMLQAHFSDLMRQTFEDREKGRSKPLEKEVKRQIRDSLTLDFIQQYPDAFYPLQLIYSEVRREATGNLDLPFIENAFQMLAPSVQNTPTGKAVMKRIEIYKRTMIGQVLPDFEQADTAGNLVKLSSFNQGKYILVDFWAGWCGPCRKEHPALVEAYARYADKGFDILGVSLDLKRDQWLAAIREDRLPWTQVSDLNGFENAVAKQFFIHAIPDNFLLNPEGVIIGRGLSGHALLEKLENIFKDLAPSQKQAGVPGDPVNRNL